MSYFPGSVSGIRSTVGLLHHWAAKLKSHAASVGSIANVTTWSGADASQARTTMNRLRACLSHASGAYSSAAGTLATFATQLAAHEANIKRFIRELQAALAAKDPNAYSDFYQKVDKEIDQYWVDVSTAAAALSGLAGGASSYGGGGPYASVLANTVGFKVGQTVGLGGQIDLSDLGLDPLSIGQGAYGDCGFLSTLMALENTTAGKNWIRSHVTWDAAADAYKVCLYKDGEPTTVTVGSVYEFGAGSGVYRGANIASVYEAAITKLVGAKTPQTLNVNDVCGYLTGKEGTLLYHAGAAETIAQLNAGKIVTVSHNSNELSTPMTVAVKDPGGTWRQDQIDLMAPHGYAVLGTDQKGNIYVADPWGPGNTADTGGEIRLTPAQFDSFFDLTWTGSVG
ncbi:MAG: hypothetical protein LBM66_03295 [Bifidobacteriaceae bacterium]|jgi:hypothetical protein|nr:hypothetical protein [Bifidobacteriaceae bacterium]